MPTRVEHHVTPPDVRVTRHHAARRRRRRFLGAGLELPSCRVCGHEPEPGGAGSLDTRRHRAEEVASHLVRFGEVQYGVKDLAVLTKRVTTIVESI
ncbi:MAG: hypothetical protein M0Z95_19360 [Actinomycetota bacterium]|nr:hypothetical protein [Actinomycetota bacterium]